MNWNGDQNSNWYHLGEQTIESIEDAHRLSQREPTPNDVLFGRGKGNQMHVGNINFLHKIDQHLDLYLQQKRGNKQKIVTMIIAWVRGRNGSFLKQTFTGTWVEVDESTAREKVSQAFRHRKLRLQEASPGTSTAVHAKKQNGDFKSSKHSRTVPPKEVLLGRDSSAKVAEISLMQDFPNRGEENTPGVAKDTGKRIGHLSLRENSEVPAKEALSRRDHSAVVTKISSVQDLSERKELANGHYVTIGKREVENAATPSTNLAKTEDAQHLPACANETKHQPRLKDADVFQLLSEYSRSQPLLKVSESLDCKDKTESKPLSCLGGALLKCQQGRSLLDEIVSDAEILDVIKAWDA